MKNSTFVASALSALMLAACQTGPKVVENPLIESANSMTLDIAKVELTDTATVLHVDAYFRPHYWIRIDSKTYLHNLCDIHILLQFGKDVPCDDAPVFCRMGQTGFQFAACIYFHNLSV